MSACGNKMNFCLMAMNFFPQSFAYWLPVHNPFKPSWTGQRQCVYVICVCVCVCVSLHAFRISPGPSRLCYILGFFGDAEVKTKRNRKLSRHRPRWLRERSPRDMQRQHMRVFIWSVYPWVCVVQKSLKGQHSLINMGFDFVCVCVCVCVCVWYDLRHLLPF